MARNYPGFLAAFFIILLRVAIGWHFLTEGHEKYELTQHGKEGFSAEVYLRNANGPLAPYFHKMVPDVDSRDMLDLSKRKSAWRADVERIADYFKFNEAQRSQAAKLVDESELWADSWFSNPENVEKRAKYFHDLDQVEKTEKDPNALEFQVERAWDARRSVEADRRSLIAPLIEHAKTLRDGVANLATTEQVASAQNTVFRQLGSAGDWVLVKTGIVAADGNSGTAEPPKAADIAPRAWTQLDVINLATTYGLIAIGMCLILGFLTPLAALGAAAFLAMIYLSMPPWPGLPINPKTEGHYYIVSKNLIELIALLVIATTPNGHWIGLDAWFFGARRRRRLAPQPSNPSPEPNANLGNDRTIPNRVPNRELDEEHRTPIPIG